jgi:CHAT domain-containing protein
MFMVSDGPEPIIVLHPSFRLSADRSIATNQRMVLWWDPDAQLPFADCEAEFFLNVFPHAEVCRNRAEACASMREPIEMLHVLCHADHNPGNPMFSALKFSDGDLSAREIAASDLRVRHANIASCSSGTLSTVTRHEPDGLVRSLLSRGASGVVASAWPLDDEASYVLNLVMLPQLAAGIPVRDALRSARLELRRQFPHPYFWGCSSLFGGYSQ